MPVKQHSPELLRLHRRIVRWFKSAGGKITPLASHWPRPRESTTMPCCRRSTSLPGSVGVMGLYAKSPCTHPARETGIPPERGGVIYEEW